MPMTVSIAEIWVFNAQTRTRQTHASTQGLCNQYITDQRGKPGDTHSNIGIKNKVSESFDEERWKSDQFVHRSPIVVVVFLVVYNLLEKFHI
jgi:hypothetical protein